MDRGLKDLLAKIGEEIGAFSVSSVEPPTVICPASPWRADLVTLPPPHGGAPAPLEIAFRKRITPAETVPLLAKITQEKERHTIALLACPAISARVAEL